MYHEPMVMAEIGCNHMGDLEIAKELLTLAKQSGCEYGKFQKRCPKELLSEWSSPGWVIDHRRPQSCPLDPRFQLPTLGHAPLMSPCIPIPAPPVLRS